MKNILSSLNESEKKRILEMHKKATNRQYLTEDFKSNITAAELATVYSSSAQVLGTDKPTGVSFTLLPKYQQPGAGNLTYNCNPAGKYYSDKFQNIGPYNGIGLAFGSEGLPLGDVLDKMEILGKRQCEVSSKSVVVKPTTTKPKTPQQQRIDLIKSTWARESQRLINVVDNNTNYFSFGYENYNDTPDFDNVSIKLFQSSNAPTLYKKVGTTEYAIYSCKTKTWAPSNHFGNTALEGKDPNANRNDIGKTPAQIAQSSVDTLCTLSTKKPQ